MTFYEVLDNVGKSEEIQGLKSLIKDSEHQKKIIDFINENHIDCNNLWEDSPIGDKATENWNKLFEFVISLVK